ncbi:unnamed protein product [Trifolium pratense]|uniref:Uncharacterized protein n=1 Tax=Trifolium pratense TaxID=57577 RepID=A0ACB0J9C1_TRIPR|nr:unnamed protein product [Trifolium pratense]
MSQKLFCSGIELASLVTSSRILCKSWSVISSESETESGHEEDIVSNDGVGLSWKVDREHGPDLMVIAFKATLDSVQADFVSSSDLKEDNFLVFEFLCSTRIPIFSLNHTAVSLFRQNHQELDRLKSQIVSSNPRTPLIVTGHGLGGSIASLFIISLFHSIGSGKNRPLCITFGSPLVGDRRFEQAISRSSIWNSCFIHVVSHKDPLPRLFITNRTSTYVPFGRFIMCSDATSFESSYSILEVFMALASVHDRNKGLESVDYGNKGLESVDYGNIVKNLYLKATCIDFSTQAENTTDQDSLATGISLQLGALELTPHMQQQQENIDINTLETKLKELEKSFILQKKTLFDPSKKLNNMKVIMAQLEWYIKKYRNLKIGYYDSYKNMNQPDVYDVVHFQKTLSSYWEKMVEEVEMKPQKEGAAFRTRWLYGGTTYRRMVEPLAIADYYRDGGKDYVNEKRSKHFKQLEYWWMEESKNATSDINSTRKKNVEAILTIDSCFWAHVEEALLLCQELKVVKENEEALKKLFEFEVYVYELLKYYAASPDIFLSQCSYIRWWNEYKEIKGSSYTSALANFMNDASNFKQYAVGAYDFP